MDLEIKGIHYEISEKTIEQIEKKAKKLEFATELVKRLIFRIEKDKSGYIISVDINFSWGLDHHIKVTDHDLYDGIDIIIDKIKSKITKEKEKIQDHSE